MHTDVNSRPFVLNGLAAAAVGLGLAAALVVPTLFVSDLARFQFLAVQLGFIGAVYFGFAVADGRIWPLLIEFPVAGAFMLAAIAALWADSPLLLAAGYAAHGLWDFVHHPRAVQSPVPRWYPPFCVVFDVAVAAFILLAVPLGGVN